MKKLKLKFTWLESWHYSSLYALVPFPSMSPAPARQQDAFSLTWSLSWVSAKGKGPKEGKKEEGRGEERRGPLRIDKAVQAAKQHNISNTDL